MYPPTGLNLFLCPPAYYICLGAWQATESGLINHAMSAGSIIAAGDLLASLTLKDPGMVKKIEPFTGTFDMVAKGPPDEATPLATLLLAMAGYAPADGQVHERGRGTDARTAPWVGFKEGSFLSCRHNHGTPPLLAPLPFLFCLFYSTC